jgi:hypothetical protein
MMNAANEQLSPSQASSDEEQVNVAWRVLAVVLALALLFTGLVFVWAMVDILENPIGRAACLAEPGCTEYFDGSSGERVVNVILGFATAGVAILAGLSAIVFAARGRGGGPMLWFTGAAILLGAATLGFGAL